MVDLESSPTTESLRQNCLSDVAYSKLRYAIMEAELRPGDRLVERKLSKKLDMGRTPIREALLRLASDGLIERVPNAGFYVCYLSLEDLEESYEIRAALEGLAVRLACRRGFSDVKLQEMEQQCDAMEESLARKDSRTFALSDFRFHQLLIAMANSQRLKAAIRNSHLQFLTTSHSDPNYVEKSKPIVEEHREIVRHLQQRNMAEAEQILREQFQRALSRRVQAHQQQIHRKSPPRLAILGEFEQDSSPPARSQKK